MSVPSVSVLMAAYNAAPYVAQAVESILRQTLHDFEILIVDDGSTDDTWSVIAGFEDPRIRAWRRQANQGKAAALNFMLQEARGEFVAIQDADDLCSSNRLEVLAGRLRSNPDVAAVFSGHALIIDGQVMAPRGRCKSFAECKQDIEKYCMPAHDPTMMCRTDIARAFGFDADLRIVEQFDFILRIGEKYFVEVVGESLYHYRVVNSSATRSDLALRAASVRRVSDKARLRRKLAPLTDEEFFKEYGREADDASNGLAGHFTDSVYCQRLVGDRVGAARTAFASLTACRLSLELIKPMVYAVAPWSIVTQLRTKGASSARSERG